MNPKKSSALPDKEASQADSHAVALNAARHLNALATALQGNRNGLSEVEDPILCVSYKELPQIFRPERIQWGVSQLFIVMDQANPAGAHVRFDFLHVEPICEEFLKGRYYRDCSLWMPQDEGSTLIVPDASTPGFFRIKPGSHLSYVDKELPGPFEMGNRRAMRRFKMNLDTLPDPELDRMTFSVYD